MIGLANMHFNPNVRKAIYAAAAGLVPLLVIAGILNEGQSQQILSSVAAALAFFASVTAIRNVGPTLPESDEFVDFEDVTEGVEPPHIPGV